MNEHRTGRLSKITKGQIVFLFVTISLCIILFFATAGMRKYAQRALQGGTVRDATPEEIERFNAKYKDEDPYSKYYINSKSDTYTVERIIDGDTIVVTTPEGKSEKVQLIGIDAPESFQNVKAIKDAEKTGQDLEMLHKMGHEATEFVKTLIKPGQEVRLEFDVQERDKYGRLLAYVNTTINMKQEETERKEDFNRMINEGDLWTLCISVNENDSCDVSLNATIIKAGYAPPMTIPPNVKYAELFLSLYKDAVTNKRGLWSDIQVENKKVEEIELMLLNAGYNPGLIDGVIDPDMRQAIAEYQQDNGLEETRKIDNATWAKLSEFEGE